MSVTHNIIALCWRATLVLLNATMYKDHPAESYIAIAAIAKAKGGV